jgi:hypothetical protein
MLLLIQRFILVLVFLVLQYCSSVYFRVYDNPRPRFELTCTKEYFFLSSTSIVHCPDHSRSHQNVYLTFFYAYVNESLTWPELKIGWRYSTCELIISALPLLGRFNWF